MGKQILFALGLMLALCTRAEAGQFSTYLEGRFVQKSATGEVVFQTNDGFYWLRLNRPPSFTRELADKKIGFWVQTHQIVRVREAMPTEPARGGGGAKLVKLERQRPGSPGS